jgi:hypothetical protein
MVTRVKGIQYSYQIDFFNQVPTRLKSQVHDLPVLSVQRPTPIDENEQKQAVIPDAENRQTYAGTNAAPPAQELISGSLTDNTVETVQNAAAPTNFTTSRQPAQIVSYPGPQENRVTPLNTEPQLNLHNVSAAEPNDIPRSDSKPDEPVKAIPKFEFNRVQKAYKPDYASFLQPAAHQDLLIANQPPVEPQPLHRPQNITPNPQNPVEMVNSRAVPIESQPIKETAAPETTTPAQLPANAREDTTTQNFLMQQAQRLYEIFGDTGLISTNRQIDFYF